MKTKAKSKHAKMLAAIDTEAKRLEPTNKLVFDKIRGYINDANYYSSENSDALLSEIVAHLVDAQRNGITAESIVGSDIGAYCRELGANLPRISGGQARSIFVAVACSALFLSILAELILALRNAPTAWLSQLNSGFTLDMSLIYSLWLTVSKKSLKAPHAILGLTGLLALNVLFFWNFGLPYKPSNLIMVSIELFVFLVLAVLVWWSVRQHSHDAK